MSILFKYFLDSKYSVIEWDLEIVFLLLIKLLDEEFIDEERGLNILWMKSYGKEFDDKWWIIIEFRSIKNRKKIYSFLVKGFISSIFREVI